MGAHNQMEGMMFKKLGAGSETDTATTTEASPEPLPRARADLEKSRLIVGPNIKLKGVEITDCDTLLVEGRVEAHMDSRVIQIAEGGVFAGQVGVDRAEIRGRFECEMTVRDRLVVHATGRVSGKVRYGRLAVEEGGESIGVLEAVPKRETAATVSSLPKPPVDLDVSGKLKREPFAHPAPTHQQQAAASAKNGGGHA